MFASGSSATFAGVGLPPADERGAKSVLASLDFTARRILSAIDNLDGKAPAYTESGQG